MLRNTNRFLFSFIIFFALPLAVQAQATCDPLAPTENCTVEEIYNFYFHYSPEAATKAAKEAGETAQNMNSTVATPDPFASRLHSTFQNFLNVFDIGISDIEEAEDGQSLTIRYNPLKPGAEREAQLGLSLTINKPSLPQIILDAIPEDQRGDASTKLEEGLGDFDDLTWAVSFTRTSGVCSEADIKSRWCWGRVESQYHDVLARFLVRAGGSAPEPPQELDIQLVEAFPDGPVNRIDATLGQAEKPMAEVIGIIKKLAVGSREAGEQSQAEFKEAGFENLGYLLDNQPQLTATASYRTLESFGPDEAAFTLELQFGRRNINWLMGAEKPEEVLAELNEDLIAKDKFVLSLSYKWRDDFTLEELLIPSADGPGTPIEDFDPIDEDGVEELMFRLQWGQPLKTEVMGEKVRFDLSIDGMWTDDDEKRNENRWIGTATLTVPLGDNMSLPISLKYADKPEFLTDVREDLGVHFGISYRLPWESAN